MPPRFDPTPRGVPVPAATEDRPRAGVIDSGALLADRKLIHIQHRGEVYSLRETRLGKLILTK